MPLVHESEIKVSVTVFCVVVLGRAFCVAVTGDRVTGSIELSSDSPIWGATAQCVIKKDYILERAFRICVDDT